MKPVLIVEGKQIEPYAIYYRDGKPQSVLIVDDYGVNRTYVDVNENTQYYVEKPLQIDFSKYLIWQGQFDEIYETLDKVIEDNQKEIQELATIIADNVEPFASVSKTVKNRETLKERTFGLMDAQEIVHAFMVDDVDLTGGEEDGKC